MKKIKYLPLYEKWMDADQKLPKGFGLCKQINRNCAMNSLLGLFFPPEHIDQKIMHNYWASGDDAHRMLGVIAAMKRNNEL